MVCSRDRIRYCNHVWYTLCDILLMLVLRLGGVLFVSHMGRQTEDQQIQSDWAVKCLFLLAIFRKQTAKTLACISVSPLEEAKTEPRSTE